MIGFVKSLIRKSPKLHHALSKLLQPPSERFVKIPDTLSGKQLHMWLRPDSYMEKEFMQHGLYGNWEKESLKIWAFLSMQAEFILDVGANTGVFSLIAKSHNTKAKVWAIEPIDTNHDVLCRNIKKNRLGILVEKVAMSSQKGSARMYMIKDQLNYMTSVNDNRYSLHPEIQGNREVVEVEIPTVDYQYLASKYGIPRLDLIKLDVEGHESEVLRSMKDEIIKSKPTILVEVIGEGNAKWMNDFFTNKGYEIVSIDEVSKSRQVEMIWDNDHHNFLLCDSSKLHQLRAAGLVV